MARYLILYTATVPAREILDNSSPEEVEASMYAWVKWKDQIDPSVEFEFGMPLQAVSRITTEGVTASDSQVSGYSIMEADAKEAVIQALANHPHLKQPGTSIDVFEMLSVPGM